MAVVLTWQHDLSQKCDALLHLCIVLPLPPFITSSLCSIDSPEFHPVTSATTPSSLIGCLRMIYWVSTLKRTPRSALVVLSTVRSGQADLLHCTAGAEGYFTALYETNQPNEMLRKTTSRNNLIPLYVMACLDT